MSNYSIDDFVKDIEYQIEDLKSGSFVSSNKILFMMKRINFTDKDIEKYAIHKPEVKYTRSLVSTDHENYTLLLLAWNPEKESPIHNHPCLGCWMKVLKGHIMEYNYDEDIEDNRLKLIGVKSYIDGQCSFINDSFGYHKISNFEDTISYTLHLYIPPFEKCKVWLDSERLDKVIEPKINIEIK